MENYKMKQEIMEAVNAGERALTSLRAAQNQLNSARNWGIWDMFGGGLFTDLIKHSKMEDASRYMEAAKLDLKIFQKELKEVQFYTELKMEIGNFLTFADFFFDGFFADYMMQTKIVETKEQVEEAIEQVEMLLIQLKTIKK